MRFQIEGDMLMFKRATVEEKCLVFLSEQGNGLVHNTAINTSKFVFHLLAQRGEFFIFNLWFWWIFR